ncbi:MAG: efflux RND transporter periplasmic adaptor subunit [Bacteroidales bacterium]|jgi:HlyD family secretion protein|nr:efflux RND transporter periplasmic adaptor subunit [Bacteroidales bacterium]
MKKFLKIFLLAVLVGLFGYTLYFLYRKSKPNPVTYQTKSPFVSNIVKKTVATGSVIPRREIEIKPKVSGIVSEIYIKEGDMIRKGDRIGKVNIIPDMANLNSAESRVRRAGISFEDARINCDRQSKLYEQKVIAIADFEKASVAFQTAKEELEAAEDNLQIIREGAARKSGQTTNTIIESTITGMVLDVPVKEGNSVTESNTFNSGTTIAIVADMGEMIFEGKVDESEVGKIKEGMNLILTIGALETETFNAELEHIAPKGVLENGAVQFKIQAKVALKPGSFIRAGYSANADIVLDKRDSVLVVEESLLKFSRDSAFVEILTAPDKFEKRYVKTGLSDGINIEVLSGVAREDKIKWTQ